MSLSFTGANLITCGLGEDNLLIARGLGEKFDLGGIRGGRRFKLYELNLKVPPWFENTEDLNLKIPIEKTILERYNILTKIQKEVEKEFKLMVKMDNRKLKLIIKII